MPITPRERLARVIDGSQAPGAFSAQLSVPARDVRLTVAGAGPVSLPVKAPQAKRMIACARPARFGRGEQTLTDLSVRDTWEITPDQVTLTGLDWDAILAEVRDELGLPARARLRAEPHALLVYGKGQFFLPHQDSEKDDTMIGTLVVSLPSSHTGGELLIDDLASLAGDRQGPVPALEPQLLDVGAGGLRYPQSVECEQGDRRVLVRLAEPCSHQQRAELVAVQRGGVRLIVHSLVHSWPPDVSGRGVIQEFFFHGVCVEPGDGAQPASDGGAGAAPGFQVAGEAFDVGAADGEQGQGAGAAPGGELAQVQRVGLADGRGLV